MVPSETEDREQKSEHRKNHEYFYHVFSFCQGVIVKNEHT